MTESKIVKLHSMLEKKEISCRELTQSYIDAIERDNIQLNAYVTATPEEALKTADKVDEKISKNESIGLLEGIPMTLKDNISTDGIRTTCCSKILEDYVPIYDATVWKFSWERQTWMNSLWVHRVKHHISAALKIRII